MKKQDLYTLLYNRMVEEQNRHRAWLVGLPAEEILDYAYRHCVREDILTAIQNMELTEEQLLALLDSSTPLADIARSFWKADIDQLEGIKYSIEETADDYYLRRELRKCGPTETEEE